MADRNREVFAKKLGFCGRSYNVCFHGYSSCHNAEMQLQYCWITSSTVLNQCKKSSRMPLCTHHDVNTPLRAGEGSSSSITFWAATLGALLFHNCLALEWFILSPSGTGGGTNCGVTVCVQTPVVPFWAGGVLQDKINVLLRPDVLRLVSRGCNIELVP